MAVKQTTKIVVWCDECRRPTESLSTVRLRAPGSATMYDTRNIRMCDDCKKKHRGSYMNVG